MFIASLIHVSFYKLMLVHKVGKLWTHAARNMNIYKYALLMVHIMEVITGVSIYIWPK